MALSFNILTQDGPARRATLQLPHGDVETPVFMPVGTAATVKAVPQEMLEQLGVQILLGNTYHLYLRPGHELIRRLGGLHRFMSWMRPILTDSGGFQVFSLNALRKVSEDGVEFRSHLDGSTHFFSPEHSIDIQIALGADIVMTFDECTEYPADHARAQSSMEMTLRWAQRSKDHFEANRHKVPWVADLVDVSADDLDLPQNLSGPNASRQNATQHLFGIVQGGMYPDLRKQCAQQLVDMDFPGYAIGGVSVGEPSTQRREIIESTLEWLPRDKPRYVMGVGFPDEIVEYAAMGVDMMDCVLPTRAARHGLLFTSQGRMNIKNRGFAADERPPDPECACQVCQRYSRAYLRHLMMTAEPLGGLLNSLHNLAFYLGTMQALRDAILLGNLTELVRTVRARQSRVGGLEKVEG